MRVTVILLALLLAGCAAKGPRVIFITVPEGYLQPCELPPAPDLNPELSTGFVQAYQCAEIGNEDKEKIIKWQEDFKARSR